jgi:FAD/FMN-containing dehydrogenase
MSRHPARRPISRRLILEGIAGCGLAARLSPVGLSWVAAAKAQSCCPEDVPRLDGDYLVDDAARRSVARDFGRSVYRLPLAVVRPRTVDDVVRIVAYANDNGIKVAMRGQAHSLYGQALVDGGIVIDSASLRHVGPPSGDTMDAQAGAMWGDVAKAALAQRRLAPVMPDAMMLSVGGTLSVGGMGETGYRFGAQVDHVRELDVVTGTGELVTCAPDREPELFAMMLAGLGQCGIIVRARLDLAAAEKFVVTRTLTYRNIDGFLADQARLTQVSALDMLSGRLNRTPMGRWDCLLTAGSFIVDAEEAPHAAEWMRGLRYDHASEAVATPIWNYLDRRTANIMVGKANSMPNPSLIVTLPGAVTGRFIAELLASPQLSTGIWFFEVSPKIPSRHAAPLQKMPDSPLAYELRMQRRASAFDAEDHTAMLAANRVLLARALDMGGKIYPPFAPVLSPAQWQQHYGPTIWQRFVAAKKQFDPNNVLNPGAGIF